MTQRSKLPYSRLLSLLLALACLQQLTAATITLEGTNITLTYTISGSEIEITDCNTDASGDLVIPTTLGTGGQEVTSIGDNAFEDCSQLGSVTLPTTLDTIGSNAFKNCTGITALNLNEGLSTILDRAFIVCTSLTEVTIPSTVTTMQTRTFRGCTSLKTATLPATITVLPTRVFKDCTALETVTMEGAVTEVTNLAFYGCTSLTYLLFKGDAPTITGSDNFFGIDTAQVQIYYYDTTANWSATFAGFTTTSFSSGTTPYYLSYTDDGTEVTIEGARNELSGALEIPVRIAGLPVTTISENAFNNNDDITSVILNEGLTELGHSAFRGCRSLESINFPSTLKSIPDNCFRGTGLTSLYVPSTIESIGIQAFDAASITNITLNDGLTTIGELAFADTDFLSIVIPDSVTNFGPYIFYNSALQELTLSEGITTVQTEAFSESYDLKYVYLPSTLTTLAGEVFYDCEALEYVFFAGSPPATGTGNNFIGTPSDFTIYYSDGATGWPAALESENAFAYASDTALQHFTYTDDGAEVTITGFETTYAGAVDIPSNIRGLPVTTLGYEAFKDCDLITSVVMPNTIDTLTGRTFRSCELLASVTLSDALTALPEWTFGSCDALTSIHLPSSIVSLGASCFRNCTLLASIDISNISTLGTSTFYETPALTQITLYDSLVEIPNSCFEGCGITSLTLPDSVRIIGPGAFTASALQTLILNDGLHTIDDEAFSDMHSLEALTIPGSVTNLGDYLTYESSIQYVTIQNGDISTIHDSAFADSEYLKGVYLPASITTIENDAFYNCISLKYVLFNGNAPSSIASDAFFKVPDNQAVLAYHDSFSSSWSSATIPTEVTAHSFSNGTNPGRLSFTSDGSAITITDCLEDTAGIATVPDQIDGIPVTTIGDYAFNECRDITEIVLPTTISALGKESFKRCGKMTTINLNDSITTIPERCFILCQALVNFTLHSTVTTLDNYAFASCHAIKSIDLSNVTTLGIGALYDCQGLESFTLNTNITHIPDECFAYTAIQNLNLPSHIESIGEEAFYDCYQLTQVTLNKELESIDSEAFAGCELLETVIVPSSVTNFEDNVFYDLPALKYVLFEGNAPTTQGSTFDTINESAVLYYYEANKDSWPANFEGIDTQMIASTPIVGETSPWLLEHGMAPNTSLTSDTNSDGIALLTEYALDLDPQENNAANLPTITIANGEAYIEYFSGRSGLAYTVKASDDLVDWDTINVTYSTPDLNSMQKASVDLSLDQCFLQLIVGVVNE